MSTSTKLNMDVNSIGVDDINNLIAAMAKESYSSTQASTSAVPIMNACQELFDKDYTFSVVNNEHGKLCGSYPSNIVLLEGEKLEGEKLEAIDGTDVMQQFYVLSDLFTKSRFARCWTRFAVPVILYRGKNICRSATIATAAEVYGRSSADLASTGGESVPGTHGSTLMSVASTQLCDRVRSLDIYLLEKLGVGCVCNLMVEERKIKYMLAVSSSETVDQKQRYSKFSLWSTPYPGCEFFSIWREKEYAGEKCYYDWEQAFVNATPKLPRSVKCLRDLDIQWSNYKRWNLLCLTQNYLRALLKYLQDGEDGILIHCISGWDRTPLFISLLRLSLWADGLVHKSLSASQILFLTIAYDWYLFGHNLPDRLAKGEEIFLFCFDFLKYIEDESFAVKENDRPSRLDNRSTDDSSGSSDSSWATLHEDPEPEAVDSTWHADGLDMLAEEIAGTFDVPSDDPHHNPPAISTCSKTRSAVSASADTELQPESLHVLQEELQLMDEVLGSHTTSVPAASSSTASSSSNERGISSFSDAVSHMRSCESPMPSSLNQPNGGERTVHSVSAKTERSQKLQQVRTYFFEAYERAVGLGSTSKAAPSSSEDASADVERPTASSSNNGSMFSAFFKFLSGND